jgi:hypothetical protein
MTAERSLAGVFIGLIAAAVAGRGSSPPSMVRDPRHAGRDAALAPALASMAVAIGPVVSVAGLAKSNIMITLGVPSERARDPFLLPTSALSDIRVVADTAALVAVVAVFAAAVDAVMRRSSAVIITVIVVIVMPFLLSGPSTFTGITVDDGNLVILWCGRRE